MFSDMKTFIAATVFGLIGMYIVGLGKKRLNYALIFSGAGLIFFPYFTPSLFWTVLVGVVLTGISWWVAGQ